MDPPRIELVPRLDEWFTNSFTALKCTDVAKAYIVSVMANRRMLDNDMSGTSIVLAYADARMHGNVRTFQRIGDWVLWASTVCPQHIEPNKEMSETLGRLSYYTCYRLLGGSWRVYEELADELPTIARDARCNLSHHCVMIGS